MLEKGVENRKFDKQYIDLKFCISKTNSYLKVFYVMVLGGLYKISERKKSGFNQKNVVKRVAKQFNLRVKFQ